MKLPSWANDKAAVDSLKRRLGDREHFVALVWARDVNVTGTGGGDGSGLRKEVIGGVDMYLLGREFPLRKVVMVGIIVEAEEKDDFTRYAREFGPS